MSGMTYLANEKVYFTSSSQYDPLNPSFKHIPGYSLILYFMRLDASLTGLIAFCACGGRATGSIYTWSRIADLP